MSERLHVAPLGVRKWCSPVWAAGLALCGAIGCNQPVRDPLAPTGPPVVWPKPPDQARIRYLGRLVGSTDVPRSRTFQESWDEFFYGPKPPSLFSTPYAVAVHEGGQRLAVADTNGKCVHRFDLSAGSYERLSSVGTPPQVFECPVGVAWAGNVLWVADSKRHALAVLEPSGASRWAGADALKRPAGIAYCRENELCYVADAGANAILAFDSQGKSVLQFGSRGSGPGQFNTPSQVACGPGPTLAVADSLNFRVQQFGPDGSPRGVFGRKGDAAGDLALPKGVAFDPDGHLWVVDAHFENVQAFAPDGRLLLAVGQEGGGVGEFSLPAGICIDQQRRIWIADAQNRRVQVFELLKHE